MITEIFISNKDFFKSKNSILNFKKYIRKTCNAYNEKKDIVDTINNHINDFYKYLNITNKYIIEFKVEEGYIINFYFKLVTPNDENKIKLKNKMLELKQKDNFKKEYKIEKKKYEKEKKKLKNDDRVDDMMIYLYNIIKSEMPNSEIPTPDEILNNLEKYTSDFENYITIAKSKKEMITYILLNNSYCSYMSFMTKIEVVLPEGLEERYNSNNLRF